MHRQQGIEKSFFDQVFPREKCLPGANVPIILCMWYDKEQPHVEEIERKKKLQSRSPFL
jgi:hypothetical protein